MIEEVRLPTGREEDLLGAGEASFRTVFIGSSEVGRVAFHGNLGGTFGGLSDVVDYRGAVTVSPVPQLTLVGELARPPHRRSRQPGRRTGAAIRRLPASTPSG